MMRKLLLSLAGAVLLFGTSVLNSFAAGPDVGMPSTNPTDGHFIGLAGPGLQTLSQPVKIWIGAQSGSTTVTVDVFDGDLGGFWDEHDPNNPVQTQFLLYADPQKTGDPTGKPLIASSTSANASMRDNNWMVQPLYSGPVHTSALAFSGDYFYLLVVHWSNPSIAANEFNAFKVGASATGPGGVSSLSQVSLAPGQQWAFVGAPVNLTLDPALHTAGNSNNGQWDWYPYVEPTPISSVSLTDCDADYRLDPANPGNPPDDKIGDAQVLIPPDIQYVLYQPDNTLLINNPAPSGNTVCKTKTASTTNTGLYHWQWVGVDAHNLVFAQLGYEVFSVRATPFPLGVPSATPTATATATVTATATGTTLPLSTPRPTSPPSSGGGAPAPAPIQPTATTTVTPLSTTVVTSTRTPTAQATVVLPSVLPRSGGEVGPIGLAGLALMVILGAGILVGRRRGQ